MKKRSMLYSTVQLIFGGIIAMLIIPASGLFVLIHTVWRAMDGILGAIEARENRTVKRDEGGLENVQKIS